MAKRYAENTSVTVERSRAEIERLLANHECTQFSTGIDHENHRAQIQFRAHNRIIRFLIHLPNPSDRAYCRDRHGYTLSDSGIAKKVAQADRQRWRALLLVIKAKLESVENNISTFEEEFMAHIVMPNNKTVGALVLPSIAAAYESGEMPQDHLLPAGRG